MGVVLLFYRYIRVADPEAQAQWQIELCERLRLTGKIRIAEEGINGTVGGETEDVREYQRQMEGHPSGIFAGMEWKESTGGADSFVGLSVKVVKELVSLGVKQDELVAAGTGMHLQPEEFHAVLENPPEDLYLLDCRNGYESQIGRFTGAVTPPVRKFSVFPRWVDEHVEEMKGKKVLMYCTGGIRCETGSAYLRMKGIQDVYQLHGGIHKYIEKYPEGFFRGKNYVFDERQSLPANQDVLGACALCGAPWDRYRTCASEDCYALVLACESCVATREGKAVYCRAECAEVGAKWTRRHATKQKGRPRERKRRKKERKEVARLAEKQERCVELLERLSDRLKVLETLVGRVDRNGH